LNTNILKENKSIKKSSFLQRPLKGYGALRKIGVDYEVDVGKALTW
jgi:hypothetical protein